MTPSFLSPSIPPASSPTVELATAHSEDDCQFEKVSQTILRLKPTNGWVASRAVSPDAAPTFFAMQQLVEMIRKLRSPANGWPAEGIATPDRLLPYVSEEAYDVLDILTAEKSDDDSNALGHQQPQCSATPSFDIDVSWPTPAPAQQTVSGLQSMEALIPQLLWQIAQSSYPVMQLIEGICVCCCTPGKAAGCEINSSYQVGMLRLVVLLEVETPSIRWCFDLATSRPPASLLSEDTVIASDQIGLLNQSGWTTAQGHQVGSLVQGVLQQIEATAPTLIPLLESVAVDLLQPGADWQTGTLQLKLGFEFIAQARNPFCSKVPAELADEIVVPDADTLLAAAATSPSNREYAELALLSLGTTTVVRLANSAQLHPFIQSAIQEQLLRNPLCFDRAANQPEQQLLSIVTEAYQIAEHVDTWLRSSLTLYQPELLMDELVPKLLWRITRSSYVAMQLLGGVAAKVLQPNQSWQKGTLRLVATLKLITAEIGWSLDLATGLPSMGQVRSPHPTSVVLAETFSCQQPTPIASITETILQSMHHKVPELGLLLSGISIEWFEAEQDWQSGMLWLDLSLEFMADAD